MQFGEIHSRTSRYISWPKKTSQVAAVQITSISWSSWPTLDDVAVSTSGVLLLGHEQLLPGDACHTLLMHVGAEKSTHGCHYVDDVFRSGVP